MFIREYQTKNKKTGNIYTNHKLVESFMTEKGPRQRIVMQLGMLTLPKSDWKKLAACIESKLSGQLTLLDHEPILEDIAGKAIEQHKLVKTIEYEQVKRKENQCFLNIDLKSLATIKHRSLGAEIVAHNIWNKLGLGSILSECKFDNRQKSLAEAIVLGRLIHPANDLATYRWFQSLSALNEILTTDLMQSGKDSFYEIVDDIFAHKKTIEKKLMEREGQMYNRGADTIFLYDLTNTYFEGAGLGNSIAEYGKCKSKRTDCRLVTLALVVDSMGFPILSEIYAGNQSEPETLDSVINRIEEDLYGNQLSMLKPTLAMDRGIATEDNIKLMVAKGFPYVIIERSDVSKEYDEQFKSAKTQFEKVETSHRSVYGDVNHVYVKKVENSPTTCRVLCLSEGKEKKEIAIAGKKDENFLEDVTKLKKSIAKGYIKSYNKIIERLGRIKERHSKVSKNYIFNVTKTCDESPVEIDVGKKIEDTKSNNLFGCYVIETTHKNLKAQEIWKLYMTLATIEGAFRAMKSELGFRPVHHHNADRTKGHLFISVLAYHLLNMIETEMKRAGDNREWSTLREVLSTHQRSTIVMRADDNSVHHIRLSSTPESEQKKIYDILGVKDELKQIDQLAINGL
jgi:transposase